MHSLTALTASISTRALLVALLLGGAQHSFGQSVPREETAPSRFTINAIDVVGGSNLSQSEIEQIVYRYMGPDRTSDDVKAAAKSVEQAYKNKGFEVSVDYNEQDSTRFAQGIVQLKINETPIGLVRVTESKHHALSVVRDEIPSVKEGKLLNLTRLNAQLGEANRYPDREVSPNFKAGQVPNTIDVDLEVKDSSPFHANAYVNNDNSPATRPLRVGGGFRYTNLWEAGHSLTVSFEVAPQNRKEEEVFSGGYTAPLIGTPWTFLVSGYKSNSNVASLGGTNVLGNGYQIGGRAIYRLPSTKNSQSISFGADYKDFQQNIFLKGVNASSAPIKYVPLVLEYDINANSGHSSIDASAAVTAGLRVLKISTSKPAEDQFNNKAINALENFVHFNANFTWTLTNKHDFASVLRLTGQLSDSHLVTNEQYSLGGLTSVRGYYLTEAVGDTGLTESLELRTPSFNDKFGKHIDDLRAYVFEDYGYARVLDSLPGQASHYSLLGVGGGARIRLLKILTGELNVGVPLIDGPTSRRGKPHTTFSMRSEF